MPALVTRISTGPSSARTVVERGVDRGAVGDVDLDASAGAPRARSSAAGAPPRAVEVEQRDAVAVGGEPRGDAEPDARRAAGDDRDAAHGAPPPASNSRCSSLRPRRIHVGS